MLQGSFKINVERDVTKYFPPTFKVIHSLLFFINLSPAEINKISSSLGVKKFLFYINIIINIISLRQKLYLIKSILSISKPPIVNIFFALILKIFPAVDKRSSMVSGARITLRSNITLRNKNIKKKKKNQDNHTL